MIGPVHENETKDRVNAIRKILNKPLVCSALLSTALLHFEGRVSSNAPKKEAANTISIKQKNMLKIAFSGKCIQGTGTEYQGYGKT